MDNNDNINYFAETDFHNKKARFGIKTEDRTKHIYIIGKTGMGKSTLLENMAIQDIRNGEGMAFIDPHGSSAEKLLDYVPKERIKDVVYFAPFDTDFPISFNVMEDVDPDKRHLVASGLISFFKKIWVDAWSARMEYMLNNALLALLEFPDSTLLGINRMFADKDYRETVVNNITDPAVRAFWVDEFAKYTDQFAAEAVPAIQHTIGQFTSNPLIRNIIGRPKSSFDVREIMDRKKILIMNLSEGRIGEQNAGLLGGMIITKIYLAAMSRAAAPGEPRLRRDASAFAKAPADAKVLADKPADAKALADKSADGPAGAAARLPNFYFYIDEFQSFANETFTDILSEAGKYKLNLTIAHQHIAQMDESVRDAIFDNTGTVISFRVGPFDAKVLEKVFAPTFSQEDLMNLDSAQIYLTLMVDGIASKPFSAATLPPIEKQPLSFKEQIIKHSREMYAMPREEIERKIKEWPSSVSLTEGLRRGKPASASLRRGRQEKPIEPIEPIEPIRPTRVVLKAAKPLDSPRLRQAGQTRGKPSPKLRELMEKVQENTEAEKPQKESAAVPEQRLGTRQEARFTAQQKDPPLPLDKLGVTARHHSKETPKSSATGQAKGQDPPSPKATARRGKKIREVPRKVLEDILRD